MTKLAVSVSNGKLITQQGKLCTECCEFCTGPDAIDLDVELPIDWCSGPSIPWGQYGSCPDSGGSGDIFLNHDKYFVNPLPGDAVLVATTDLLFDADMAVDGVSLSQSILGINCPVFTHIPRGTTLSSPIGPGQQVHLQVIDRFGVKTGGTGCIRWKII